MRCFDLVLRTLASVKLRPWRILVVVALLGLVGIGQSPVRVHLLREPLRLGELAQGELLIERLPRTDDTDRHGFSNARGACQPREERAAIDRLAFEADDDVASSQTRFVGRAAGLYVFD